MTSFYHGNLFSHEAKAAIRRVKGSKDMYEKSNTRKFQRVKCRNRIIEKVFRFLRIMKNKKKMLFLNQ